MVGPFSLAEADLLQELTVCYDLVLWKCDKSKAKAVEEGFD